MVTEAKIKFNPSPRYNADGIPIRFGSSQDSRILYDGTNNEWTVQTKDASGTQTDRIRVEANTDTPDIDVVDLSIKWTAGRAPTAGDYSIIRNADGTNQLQVNVPTGAGFEWSINDVGKLILDTNGALYVGETVNAKMTQGVTVNQGASDDEILALKSSDVAHGVTDRAETDTYALLAKGSGTDGSLLIRGFADTGSQGVVIRGHAPTDDATKSTAAVGYVRLEARKHNGTADQAAGADANVLVVSNGGTVTHILDGDGDSHQDVGTAWTNYDDFDDLGILESLSMALAQPGSELKEVFRGFLEYNRPWLEEHKIVAFNQDGHHFINWSRFHMVTAGALRQVGRRLINIEHEMRALKGAV